MPMMFTYNYNTISDKDISALYSGDNSIKESLNLTVKNYKYNDTNYEIIKYKKEKLNDENIHTSGLFRSVICKNKNIVSIAPPKSQSYNAFMNNHHLNECVVEEYVEGTMINMFYDNEAEQWENRVTTLARRRARGTVFKNAGKPNDSVASARR